MRGARPFNWVAKSSELDDALDDSRNTQRGPLDEEERATRMRDLLGLADCAEDYLVLIIFPDDISVARLAKPTVLEGVIGPFRPRDASVLGQDS